MDHIIDLFEHTAAVYSDKPAVVYKEQAYSFAGMKKAAQEIAAFICEKLGGAMQQPVAVMVNRDADTAVYFLGVLYSGNYYVPIDPDMPLTKKLSVIGDCEPKILLCGEAQKELAAELEYQGVVVSLKDIHNAGQQDDPEIVLAPIREKYSPNDPVYMVYTSGSTGKPKGVLKSHSAVCSFVRAFSKEFSLDDTTVIGNQTPFFFDASAKDYYLMIYVGATMEIIPSELFMYPPKLIDYLNERQVTYICWVPTALAMVTQINTFKQVMPTTLKQVFFVGEVFPLKQLRKWMEALPQLEYVNLYGSTELSGISCYARLNTAEVPEYVPVGRGLSNCTVFLYDNDQKTVVTEREQIGELCVISDAMAMEYYHDPEKTAQVFVTMDAGALGLEGYAEGQEVRVLKTGDLARYDAKGDIVFSSRKDFQIKLMGRRIELGEIEAAADKVPEIQRNCCIFDAERRKIKMYCELIAGCDWTGRMIRQELTKRLSDYMVPSSVTVMKHLPLNANGKIDRSSLKNMK